MSLPCRVFQEPAPLSGAVNMQRDEQMLQFVANSSDVCLLRIYRWNEPTVSLGHFQKDAADIDARLLHCPRVKRLSGGGAILHDQEITYSCAFPNVHPFRCEPVRAYEVLHTAVVDLLSSCGAQCAMRGESLPNSAAAEPFLCFLREDPRDVVLNGVKVLGSAQRRRRGSILQHGSILLQASTLTPELPGILDLCPAFDVDRFTADLPAAVANSIAEGFELATWPPCSP